MNEHEATLVARTATLIARMHPEVGQQMHEDANAFFVNLILDLGLTPPDGFHAHSIERGEGLPDESSLANQTRSIFVLRHNSSIEHVVIPPQVGGSGVVPKAIAGGVGKCNGCAICIVVEK